MVGMNPVKTPKNIDVKVTVEGHLAFQLFIYIRKLVGILTGMNPVRLQKAIVCIGAVESCTTFQTEHGVRKLSGV